MLEKLMIHYKYTYERLDGSIKQSLRDPICKKFNNSPHILCFLLTSQVSGVGLNLVGADRAIVLDPDWNPANDNQSIDRLHRIGQLRDVIVYRLISSNTLEEKIYRRQVFKSGLSKANLEDKHETLTRYFNEFEYLDLLNFDHKAYKCETIDMLNNKHGYEQGFVDTPTNQRHIKFLQSLPEVQGITNHAKLFSCEEEMVHTDNIDLDAN